MGSTPQPWQLCGSGLEDAHKSRQRSRWVTCTLRRRCRLVPLIPQERPSAAWMGNVDATPSAAAIRRLSVQGQLRPLAVDLTAVASWSAVHEEWSLAGATSSSRAKLTRDPKQSIALRCVSFRLRGNICGTTTSPTCAFHQLV